MQTAVDYLEQKFIMIQWLLNRNEISKARVDALLNQFSGEAKKLEKSQIMRAYDMGNDNAYRRMKDKNYINVDEEEYYEKVMFIYNPDNP